MYSEEQFYKYKGDDHVLYVWYYSDAFMEETPVVMGHKTYEEYVEFYKKWEKDL